MGRATIPGIYRDKEGNWQVDKWVRRTRLRRGFGADYGEAESWVLTEIQRIKRPQPVAPRRRLFSEAAAHYCTLFENKASIEDELRHLNDVMPFIGHLHLDQVYDATLKPFIDKRKADGVRSKTINLALGTVRRILNLAARAWREEDGKTWLSAAPLITLVEGGDEDEPKQLTWKQQREHLSKLPDHLARMALFDLNCGARDAVICGLRWEWEVEVPELGFSVFVVPAPAVKGRKGKKRARVIVCNSVAQRIIESVRGMHPEYVFVYQRNRDRANSKGTQRKDYTPKPPRPIATMNNTAWQKWRERCGLKGFSPHDLRHTVGMRLREAGVNEETRADILWHNRKGMPQHYAVAQLREIHAALELISDERFAFNRSLASIVRDAQDAKEVPETGTLERKSG